MFAAEKGLDLPTVTVDLMGGENRQSPHLERNPFGQTPTLELSDGSYLTEITAICEYLDEYRPDPPLIGVTAEERAKTRMWTRRIDLNIVEPMVNGFRFSEGLSLFQSRITCIPEAAAPLKAIAQKWLTWLSSDMEGRSYVVSDRFTLADVMLYCFVAFGESVGQPLQPEHGPLKAWFDRVKARPSASA
jgi:glutathione S-transferase